MADDRPTAHISEPTEAEAQAAQKEQDALQVQEAMKGQTLKEAVQGLTLSPQENKAKTDQETQDKSDKNLPPTGPGGGQFGPEQFKQLFGGRGLDEAVAILIPNINHALKVGTTARKNEPLIQAMMTEYKSIAMAETALQSLLQGAGGNSLAAQMSSGMQNQNNAA